MKRAYTDADLKNVFTYGVCMVCGEPRRREVAEEEIEGKVVRVSRLVYPCGHTFEDELDQPRG